ncbi:MAG: hypothetical protein HY720_22655 [Planctomycetes bacterium]|nr:hypothetical protein [Planctomycetota bacterium]
MTESQKHLERARRRIQAVKALIQAVDHVASGTLSHRLKTCGTPGCRCAKSPEERHGPYFEWSRLEQRRLRGTQVQPAVAHRIARAIKNYRRVKRLLRRWERESVKVFRAELDASARAASR